MHIATLLHNPGAGEKSYTEAELISKIEAGGFKCLYSSLDDDNWINFDPSSEFLIITGGDGTVRKVTEQLLLNNISSKYPLALLPAGTANNIARTLNISDDAGEVIESWKREKVKKFDFGRIDHIASTFFFLESIGFGVFPELMQEMEKQDEQLKDSQEKSLNLALELLCNIVSSFEPFSCEIEMGEARHSGKYLLVEIMNTRSIGPNLFLSPHGDPGDGEFEVVLIPESQKDKLLTYLTNKLRGLEQPDLFDVFKTKAVRIKCDQHLAHVDDELVEVDATTEINIQLIEGAFGLLI